MTATRSGSVPLWSPGVPLAAHGGLGGRVAGTWPSIAEIHANRRHPPLLLLGHLPAHPLRLPQRGGHQATLPHRSLESRESGSCTPTSGRCVAHTRCRPRARRGSHEGGHRGHRALPLTRPLPEDRTAESPATAASPLGPRPIVTAGPGDNRPHGQAQVADIKHTTPSSQGEARGSRKETPQVEGCRAAPCPAGPQSRDVPAFPGDRAVSDVHCELKVLDVPRQGVGSERGCVPISTSNARRRAAPARGPRASMSPCAARERGHPSLFQRPHHQPQRRTPPAPAWPSREQCSAHGHFWGALVKADPVFSCPGTSAARVRPPREGPAPS